MQSPWNLHALKRAKYRGLSKVQIQAYMTGVVQNLKRLIQATVTDIISGTYYLYDIFTKRIKFALNIFIQEALDKFYKISLL